MKHTSLTLGGIVLGLMFPVLASAHEHQVFRIGDKTYDFTVGSLNEPIVVDDKGGVEFSVWTVETPGVKAGPVTGLEQTLKVEVQAAGKKKMMDLDPAWGEDGSYHAVFYPTVATSYAYRFVGTLNNVPIDLTFTCSGAGHDMAGHEVSNGETKIADNVTRIEKRGSFSCPQPKAPMGFPEPASSLADLQSSGGGGSTGNVALPIAVLGMVFGLAALRKTRKLQ